MKYFLILISVVLNSFVFAQNITEDNITTGTRELTNNLDMWLVHNNQINKVVLKFCNNWFTTDQLSSSLDLVMRPGQKKDVCVVLVNQSNDSLNIVGNIVPGSINPNWNIICSNVGQLTWDIFASDFSVFEEPVVLWPQEQLIKHFVLSANDVASGNYYWCFAINLSTVQKLSESSPFNLVVRKAGNIKIKVEWSPYHFQWFNDILRFIQKYTRGIAIVGLIACWLLLISTLVPIFGKKNKKIQKKPTHKK